MRAHPTCRAVAVEAAAERAERIGRNAATLGVPALDIVHGHAPEALEPLPAPDAAATPAETVDRTTSGAATPPPSSGPVAAAVSIVTPPALRVGDSLTLRALALGASGDTMAGLPIRWWSDDGAVVAVNPRSGVARALTPGTVTVRARAGRRSAAAELTVLPAAVATLQILGARPMAVGEMLALLAAWQPAPGLSLGLFRTLMVVGGIGTLLTAGYFLWMLQRVDYGRVPERWRASPLADVLAIESISWAPLLLLIVAIGLVPGLVLGITNPAVEAWFGGLFQ